MNSAVNDNFFNTVSENNTTVIQISERFSALEAASFPDFFQSLQKSHFASERVVLDFAKTQFIDSSGIGALAVAIKLSQTSNFRLTVRTLNEQVLAALKLTGMDMLLHIQQKRTDNGKITSAEKKSIHATHPSIRSKTKRAMDILGSLVGLFITALLFPFIALAIKLESPGPVFFSQVRCGWLGSRFRIYKFRTMVSNAENRKHEIKNEASGAIFKTSNDPRITRVGKFLRKTSLDELPQFWNVLSGSMSLIGTRPPTPDEVEQYCVPQWQRLDVKPGISGEWQVNGRSNVKDFTDIIKLDLKYQKNWSLTYDIKLILRTVFVIFSKDSGAM